MRSVKIPNNSQQIITTVIAQSLETLMEVAFWWKLKNIVVDYLMIDNIDIYTEWDIRYNTSAIPTLISWMVLANKSTRTFRWIHPSKLFLCWNNVKVNIQLWATKDQ